MTLRATITEAAFWHEKVCLGCGTTFEEVGPSCPECDSSDLVDARALLSAIETVEAEGDGGGEHF